jgi:enoyl-[acyl-carrier protein] reductase I
MYKLQVPALNIFETSFRRGKFDESRKLSNGGMLDFAHIYPMDAVFDTPEDVPEEVSWSKLVKLVKPWSINVESGQTR